MIDTKREAKASQSTNCKKKNAIYAGGWGFDWWLSELQASNKVYQQEILH